MQRDELKTTELWVALGSQPGVSAWFAVWILSRLSRPSKGRHVPALQKPSPAVHPGAAP